ncbi:MAG: peptide chain release factor 2 [Desulfovibrionaceae bacterium]|nr:peptide chain release factor 2 [Desulfovibrionaceae bacterium]
MIQFDDLKSRAATLDTQFQTLWGRLDQPAREKRLQELEAVISAPGAWDNPEKLTPVLREKSAVENELERFNALRECREELFSWLEMAQELSAESETTEEDLNEALSSAEKSCVRLGELLEETETSLLLSQEEDHFNAILEIHPGAGGTEAQDWAEMLQRMYLRWADIHHFAVEELDYLVGDEAGIKSVTLRISGQNVFGLLKGERGIHRLIRISPFDASGRRHTSFASVDVIPDTPDDIVVDIKESDLRIDIFRSSGPGGQSVNTTSSAVRITHLPTGLVAQCQNEKSQHHNKESALRILKGRIYDLELRKKEEQLKAQYADKNAISFGSQIRTYTLQPYRLVKDHRSGCEIGDVDAVLNGRIDRLLRDYLLSLHSGSKSN